MSKMDRQLNSKKDKETIYEIYRACRLCGAGAGYKMPIIQSVVDVDDTEVELKQKVRECVQIEVHQDDKMPPLICELCVDKVNDFYEFLEMCRQTNKRTRLRLGLPPQSMPRGAPDAGECILGLTEPVYVNEDSDGEPLSKQKKMSSKVKVKREPELKVRLENRILTESRTTRFGKRSPTPPRVTRHRTSSKEDNVSLNRLKDKPKSSPKSAPAPKSILKKETKNEDNSLLVPRLKRSRDKEPVKLDTTNKRVKIATKTSPPTQKSSPTTSPRTRPIKPVKISPKRAPSPPRLHKCPVCGQAYKTAQANVSHMRSHTVGFTSLRMACNPCGLWFATPEEAAAHHKSHRSKSHPYVCRRCETEFRQISAYDEHFENKQCIPIAEVPDVKCAVCWHQFATHKLLGEHRCVGEEHRPGGKCSKCRRSYALLKNLKKHEQTCTAKKKGELIIDPVLLSKVKPIQIRVSRCDPLLTNLKQEHYDVSNVTADFGLDKNCVYPYIASYSRLRIKSDPDGMVDINAEIKDEFYIEEDYIHWDSEDSESEEDGSSSPSLVLTPYVKKKKIETLANLTLKTIFSKRCLGKVPKKKRRVKREKMFDSLLVGTEDDVTRDINNIIDNLGDDDDEFDGESQKGGDESQKGDDEGKKGDDDSQKGDGESQKGGDESQMEDGESQKGSDECQMAEGKDLGDTDKSMDVSDDKVNVTSDKDVSHVDENDKSNDKISLTDNNDSLEKTEQNAQINDKLCEVNERNDQNTSEIDEDKDTRATKHFNSDVNNDTNGANNSISSNNGNNNLDDRVNNGINSLSFDYFDGDDVSKQGSESQNDEMKIDFENSQDSNSIGGVSESLLNENTQSDVTSLSDKVTNVIDNATSLPEQKSDIDSKSLSNELSVDNLSQDSKISESEAIIDNQKSEGQSESRNQRNDNVTETDYKNAISVIVNCDKNKIATDSEEMDDSKLMEALDAQIGDSNENSREHTNSRSQANESFNNKIALEDLISAKSSDMDSYQDFNFDA